jgi:hypothetical protein
MIHMARGHINRPKTLRMPGLGAPSNRKFTLAIERLVDSRRWQEAVDTEYFWVRLFYGS